MITSKLTSKARTTVPQPVRMALLLKRGDELAYQIEGDRVILTKGGAGSATNTFALSDEWSSPADQIAYAKL